MQNRVLAALGPAWSGPPHRTMGRKHGRTRHRQPPSRTMGRKRGRTRHGQPPNRTMGRIESRRLVDFVLLLVVYRAAEMAAMVSVWLVGWRRAIEVSER